MASKTTEVKRRPVWDTDSAWPPRPSPHKHEEQRPSSPRKGQQPGGNLGSVCRRSDAHAPAPHLSTQPL